MAIQNVVLDDDVFKLGESKELKGDESTDTSTKDECLKYNKEEAPKPEDASTLNKDMNSNVSPENQAVASQPSVTPSVDNVPTPQVPPVQAQPQSVSVQNETNDSGDDGSSKTIKPSFTNPEEFSDVEVL
jgi:hypothetical protein